MALPQKLSVIGLSFLALVSPANSFKSPLPFFSSDFARSRKVPTSLRASSSEESSQRQPWEAFRFLKQSSRFIRPPNPFRSPERAIDVNPGDILWSSDGDDAGTIGPNLSWAPLDDVVMGGASSSEFDNVTGRWVGRVSGANNGGFVGVRTAPFEPALDMSNCRGIELRLRDGNKRRFKAVVRDSTEFNGVCWTTSFDAPRGDGLGGGGSATVRLPFAKNIPTIFAKQVSGKSFRTDNVMGLQLVYSKFELEGALNPKFQLGDFSLQLLEVKAY